MPRSKKSRNVSAPPPCTIFKPAGVPAREAEWVKLRLDEYEAVRLADYEGLKQEEVAERLGVSRPTVSRILEEGRRRIARALVEAANLLIEGGPVNLVGPGYGRGRRWRGGRGGGPPPAGGPRG